jgi:hypothetical protein
LVHQHLCGLQLAGCEHAQREICGTVYRHSRSGSEEFSEYDINFDLRFHLKKYLWRVFDAYDRSKKYHKQDVRPSHRTNYDTIPYVRDTNWIDNRNYRLHCELTPPDAFRPQINYLFFPTLPGYGGLKEHPNFKNRAPQHGFLWRVMQRLQPQTVVPRCTPTNGCGG